MFSGIVNTVAVIDKVEQHGDLRITIGCDYHADDLWLGRSIAVNGVCLTVVDSGKRGGMFGSSNESWFSADLSQETISRTAPGQWESGKRVNLESSLRAGDPLDGHLVTGHVDGIASIIEITPSGDSKIIGLEAPSPLARFIVEKGSVTLDGVSLTINKVAGRRFWVNIIPHTQEVTTLSDRAVGDMVNLEIDPIARYVDRLLVKQYG